MGSCFSLLWLYVVCAYFRQKVKHTAKVFHSNHSPTNCIIPFECYGELPTKSHNTVGMLRSDRGKGITKSCVSIYSLKTLTSYHNVEKMMDANF